MTTPTPPILHAAIYTRKSTDEGLDQAFNSLDAQYEAALTYIQQRYPLGWRVVPERFDDGGFTGGTMERPALQRLLQAIAQGTIQVVVTYKLDRITRSLLDFAQLMRTFEQHQVAFVSVTQDFDSSTPVGRLTLNILSSFAQYEREIISERTRDKMAATRRKGMYTGGIPPFGYQLDTQAHRLVPDPEEAAVVHTIYAEFLKQRSVTALVRWLNARDIPTKRHQAATGRTYAGGRWTKAYVRKLLTNPLYRGQIQYHGTCYPGQQEALIDTATWEAVQAVFRKVPRDTQAPRQVALLRGRLRCGHCGGAMSPSCCRDGTRVYRYYLCATSHRQGTQTCPTRSIPAGTVETAVVDQLCALLHSPEPLLGQLTAETDPGRRKAHYALCASLHQLSQTWTLLQPAAQHAVIRQLVQQVVVYPDRLEVEFVTDGALTPAALEACYG
jgi:DNA invertase Pin-like site-specific DNA recombinase